MTTATDPIRVLYTVADLDHEDVDCLEAAAEDFAVIAATSSAEARDVLAESPVDCLVSRYDLPDETGVDLLRRVRDDDPDLPFILSPAEGSEAIASEAISAGVTGYLRDTPDGDQSAELASLVRDAVKDTSTPDDAGWDLDSDIDPDLDLPSQTNLLEQIFTQVPVSLYVKDTEGRHLLMSDYETSPVEATGKTDLEIYEDELARESFEDDMQVIETGEAIHNKEEYSPDVDGWVLTSKVPWYGEDGEIRGLIGVTRFITEKKEYEREIERKNDRLERFASVISHDLRNPLTVAQGRLEFVSDDVEDEHLDTAAAALDRMEALIDDVLELARQGQTIDETESVMLSAAVECSWANVERGDATVEVDEDYHVQADRSRLVELLGNFFRNSIEHSSSDATVRVGSIDGEPGFFVEDDGPGVPDGEKDDVFEPGHTTADDGTGFGLAIVTEIVDAHGWDVAVTDADDGGARFEITGVDGSE